MSIRVGYVFVTFVLVIRLNFFVIKILSGINKVLCSIRENVFVLCLSHELEIVVRLVRFIVFRIIEIIIGIIYRIGILAMLEIMLEIIVIIRVGV